MVRLLLAALTALLAFGLVAGVATAQDQSDAAPAAVYNRLVDALNRGDIPAALTLFTDDVHRQGGRLCAKGCVGKDALSKEYAAQQADHTRVTVVSGSVQVSGTRLTAREEVRSDSFRAAGAERLIILKTIELTGDKISYIASKLDLSDPQTAAYAKARATAAALPRSGEPTPQWPVGAGVGVVLLGLGLVHRRIRRSA